MPEHSARRLVALAAAITPALAAPAFAEDDLGRRALDAIQPEDNRTPADEPGALDRTSVQFRAAAEYTGSADLDTGEVSIARLDTAISTRTAIGDSSALSFRIGSEFSFYDFADVGPFGVDGGMDSGARYTVGTTFSSQIDDRWGYFVGGSVTASPGEGASWGDSITGGGVAGFTYQITDSLRVGAGIGISSRLEDDARFIPVPNIEWQIDEQWRLATTSRGLGVRGLELSYDANEWLTLFALGGWASREYRLDDDGGPAPDGVLRDERVPLYIGATFKPADNVSIDVGVGGSVWSQFELLDSGGTEIADSDADPALGGWIGATVRF